MKLKLILLTLAIGLVGAAHAADQKTDAKPTPPVGQSGIKIYVDPATGQWSQTPLTDEQRRAAVSTAPADMSKIKTVMHADGSIEYQMNGQFMDSMVATRGADGKLHIECSEKGLEHAHAAAPVQAAGESNER